ncbi:hypothetical protein [Agromyces sp. S2-1-8]|uniref:hypothetical protein n=1 Tax=Agromyces sp. S2-1-8 TaxID=2897180 RepID=UPI001E366636|nr:hypothetical protein [Agromyces sp. S2-1-8]MCD5348447.1 hypothetical protein [Agromyces sp. S2-1-8]
MTLDNLAEWIGALAACLTAVAVVFAAFQYRLDRSRRRDELDRAAKEQAMRFAAWVVSDRRPPKQYGVVASNQSRSTFHNVRIDAVLFGESLPEIELNVLPPGDFFVALDQKTREWRYAVACAEHGGHLRPYTRTGRYKVRSVSFMDNREATWSMNEHMVVTQTF